MVNEESNLIDFNKTYPIIYDANRGFKGTIFERENDDFLPNNTAGTNSFCHKAEMKNVPEPNRWRKLFLRCHQPETSTSWEPGFWKNLCPFPYFPTYRQFAQMSSIVVVFILTWGVLWSILGDMVSPNGQLFSMFICVLAAYLGGWLFLKITTLPALIGMLLIGILFQNMGWIHMSGDYLKLNSNLRKVALIVILTRAGLGLDSKTLIKNKIGVLKLGLLPWAAEAVSIAVVTYYLLDLPWIWGFLLGSMTASVSPAVVVPCLFRLKAEGYGVAKGIPTLLLAAAAIDDSISVATFGIIFSAMFSTSSLAYTIAKGPCSIIAGVSFGILMGSVASIIPEKGDKYAATLRFLYVLSIGLFSVFFSNKMGWDGAGPLAVVACGFTAAIYWRREGWKVNDNPVCTAFRILWIVFEPTLFAFTGASVKVSELDLETVKFGLACLVICALLRMIVTFIVGYGCGLNYKEKIFIGVTWLSKATVQAALGPVALDFVLSGGTSEPNAERYARTVLTVSILSVVLTAPLSAILIAVTGPKLLSKELPEDLQEIPLPHVSGPVSDQSTKAEP